MEIKKVTEQYIDDVMIIINDAKKYLAPHSLQWQQGYPETSDMMKDISNRNLFGLFEDGKLICIAALIKGVERTYVKMVEGKWNIDVSENDLVIHRIAIKDEYRKKGYARKMMEYAISYAEEHDCPSIKIDTHRVNYDMQNLCLKTGFTYQGVIDLDRGEEDELRLAYEYVVK